MTSTRQTGSLLGHPLVLPCGAVIKNRIIKSAMSDSLGDGEGSPTDAQIRLYERWAEGGIGLSIIGEVQIDPRYPEKPGNLVLNKESRALRALASKASIQGAHIWPQLGHAGGLSCVSISQPKGPSALSVGDFQCEGMSLKEVTQLPKLYANAALIAKNTGFTGVQIHAGHGFLLSQFLSPLFNRREDRYGGSIEARCRIIIEIIESVRDAVGIHFPIGIKINSTDQLEGGLTQEDSLQAIRMLSNTTLDLIEVSGGSYFPGANSSSDSDTKGPYFVDFSEKARSITSIPIVVTGGIKTHQQALNVLENNFADAIGLARSLVLDFALPNNWLSGKVDNLSFPRFTNPPQGGITAWYTMLLTAIGNDSESDFSMELSTAIERYQDRDQVRCQSWLAKY